MILKQKVNTMIRFTEIDFYIPNSSQNNPEEYIKDKYQNPSMILVVGRENNNVVTSDLIEKLGYYNFIESPRSSFYNKSFGFIKYLLENKIDLKKEAKEKGISRILFSNSYPVPIPATDNKKDKIRAQSLNLISEHWDGIAQLYKEKFPSNCKIEALILSFLKEREFKDKSKLNDIKKNIIEQASKFCSKYDIELYEIPYIAAPTSYDNISSYLNIKEKKKLLSSIIENPVIT